MPLKKKSYNSDDSKVASLSHWALFYAYNSEYLSGNNSFFRKSRKPLCILTVEKGRAKPPLTFSTGFQ